MYFANKESDQPFNYNDDGEDEMLKEVSKKQISYINILYQSKIRMVNVYTSI